MSQTTERQGGQARMQVQSVAPFFEGFCNQGALLAPEPVRADLIKAACEATVSTLTAVAQNYELMSPRDFRSWLESQGNRILKIGIEAAQPQPGAA